ncbi:hypothetical protein [Candidatus Poriferisodalis sp.]|uniref:hypothetical protein n=1 Tax=Candidatus Poriferisodalis sp. TaxID=3101277 RepID=UPI003B5B1130
MIDDARVQEEIDQERMLVLSLKPWFAEAILSGDKTVELRRVEPKIIVPTRALVYATTPLRAMLGTCIVTAVVSDQLATLWETFGSRTGLQHAEFLHYFSGAKVGTALTLRAAKRFDVQIPLAELRSSPGGFRPPRSFAYLDTVSGNQLLQIAA